MGRGRRPRIPSCGAGRRPAVRVPEEPASQPASQAARAGRSKGAARPAGMGPPRPALRLLLLLLAAAGACAREWGGPACARAGLRPRGGGRGLRARPRVARWGSGESTGWGAGSPDPASPRKARSPRRCPSPRDAGAHRRKTGDAQQCLSPFLTEDEVPENVSPGCASKALPHWAGQGAPSPQATLLHVCSLKCWDAGMAVHRSEPQEAGPLSLCLPPRELNFVLLAVLVCPQSMAWGQRGAGGGRDCHTVGPWTL